MRVGIELYTIRELNLTPYQVFDWAEEREFEGVQFMGIRRINDSLDVGVLKDLRAYGDSKGLYSHVSVTAVNPVIFADGFDALKKRIEEEIAAAAACGWRELHSYINAGTERYTHPVPWPVHVEQCIMLINALRPTLEKYGARINIETHGEATFDALRVIECTGTHLTGVCLDTANTLVNAEDPVLAAKRVAPYTHLTHIKDAIITMGDGGIIRQGRPPGAGCVDFETILPILGEYCPNLPLSIEDHKKLYTAKIFDEDWIAKNRELTPYELGQFVHLAWQGHEKIKRGELPPLDEYEAIPYMDQMEERLLFGRQYLLAQLQKLNLRNGCNNG
jgi:sugar phosphate isomerase/epimerase